METKKLLAFCSLVTFLYLTVGISAFPQSEQLISGLPVKIRREHFGFGTRFVEIILPRSYYSKENLERLWRYYCEKYSDKKDKLDIRVFVERATVASDATQGRSFDANFNRQGEGAAALGGDNEFYSYLPDLDKPNETEEVQLKGRYPFLTGSYSGDQPSDFVLAAHKGDVTRLISFLAGAGDVNVQNEKGRTALMSACAGGQVGVVKLLLAKGANPNLKDKGRDTALCLAAMSSAPDAPNQTGFHANIEIVRLLLANGADVKDNNGGWPALVVAAERGNNEIVKLLIEKGADINVKNWVGMTALSRAIYDGKLETAKILLAAGSDIESRDRSGETALMFATSRGLEFARALVAKGANPNVANDVGETALMRAHSVETVALLLDHGADLNSKDKKGRTALMHAVAGRHLEKTRVLLERGAEVNQRNIEGETALAIARQYSDNRPIIETLLKFGATE